MALGEQHAQVELSDNMTLFGGGSSHLAASAKFCGEPWPS